MNINVFYKTLLKKIYEEGFVYEDLNRKGVKRKQISFVHFEHNFEDGFPLIGLKQCYPKMAFNEMKCFFNGYTNLKNLEENGVTFWRKDAFNYYKKLFPKSDITIEEFLERTMSQKWDWDESMAYYEYGDLGNIYSYQIRNFNNDVDQLSVILERLKKHPNATKNLITMWNPCDTNFCALSPCHTAFSFIVENLKDGTKGLRVHWSQGSVDTVLGLPSNILYYSFVCQVVAHYLNMKPLGIIGSLENVHLYDNSFDAVETLLERNVDTLQPVTIETNFPSREKSVDKFFEDLDYSQVHISNYKHLGRVDVEMLAYNK